MSLYVRTFVRRASGPILTLGALAILTTIVSCQSPQVPPPASAPVNLAPIEFRLTALEAQAAQVNQTADTLDNVTFIEERVTELESKLDTVAGQLGEVIALASRTDQQVSTLRDSIYNLQERTAPPAFTPEEQSAIDQSTHEDEN